MSGSTRLQKVEVWKKLDAMVKVLRREVFTDTDKQLLQKSCVEFVDAVSKAWGPYHITHYMVSYSHIHFFLMNFF